MIRLAAGLLILAMPVIEIALLIKTGQMIGFWATMAIVAATGMLGVAVLTHQRLAVLGRTMHAVREGHPPIAPVLDGAFQLLAGGLLISPGLICDAAGLLLLVPPLRRTFARWSISRLLAGADVQVTMWGRQEHARSPSEAASGEGPIIEGEFERLGEKTVERGRGARKPS